MDAYFSSKSVETQFNIYRYNIVLDCRAFIAFPKKKETWLYDVQKHFLILKIISDISEYWVLGKFFKLGINIILKYCNNTIEFYLSSEIRNITAVSKFRLELSPP